MSSGPNVAIIGGTGFVGLNISNAFVTDFRSSFSHVRILTRDATSPKAQGLAYEGAELAQVDETDVHRSLDEAFAGIDVIVNTLPSSVPDRVNRHVLQAVARSNAKVYFLSEFETDHRATDFPGYEPREWSRRQDLAHEARRSFSGKVIALYTSLFCELALGHPVLGFDIANNEFTAYGSPAQRISFTSLRDVGRAVARLALLATDPHPDSAMRPSVPDDVRVAGSTVSFEDVRDIVARVRGVAPARIRTANLAERKRALRLPGASFNDFVRVVMGEGKMDFGEANDNELVNPGGTLWTWKSAEDYIRGQLAARRSG